jgi:hypothetical protein
MTDRYFYVLLLRFGVSFILTENFNDVCKLFQRRVTLIAWGISKAKLTLISCREEYKLSNY